MPFLLLCFVLTTDITVEWTANKGIQNPQDLIWDNNRDGLLVVNGGEDDYVSFISADGQSQKVVVRGLVNPKAVAQQSDGIVVLEQKSLVFIDASGVISERIKIPSAQTLQAITIGANNQIWLTDSGSNKIFLIKNKEVATYATGDHLHQPMGLLENGGQLLFACWGGPDALGAIRMLPLIDGARTELWSGELGRLVDLVPDGNYGYYVTEQAKRSLLHISEEGRLIKRYPLNGKPGSLVYKNGTLYLIVDDAIKAMTLK